MKKNRTVHIYLKTKYRVNDHGAFKWNLLISMILALMVASWSTGWAISGNYIEIKTLPLKEALQTTLNWHVSAYQIKEEGGVFLTTTKISARLCFWHDEKEKQHLCFPAEIGPSKFPVVKELSIVPFRKNREPKYGILFISTHLGAIEPLHLISIWIFRKEIDTFVNVLPHIILNEQSEYKLFSIFKEKEEVIFVTANRIWKGGEEMLYGPHQFEISIYKYTEKNIFKYVDKYITKRKYLSFENAHRIDVIRPELRNIEKYFRLN